ncbi:MAG: methyl-accepting chemotaxis protein [Candidatus Edwardsbacteria bacterium]|nr:methyl-accepting chemotaxis protein [Candidatus Edwardsbacteria bacterium]
MDIRNERREKALDYTLKAAISTMILTTVVGVIMALGWKYKFMEFPVKLTYLVMGDFILALVLFALGKRNVFHYGMSFILSTANILILSYALAYVSPATRFPFFLFYFYIVLHPAMMLGLFNGGCAVLLTDVSYLLMIFLTGKQYPEVSLGLEIAKLVIFTIVSMMLILDMEKNLKRIGIIRKLMGQAEQGDLTQRAIDREKDEIFFLGISLNNMLENEIKIVSLIAEAVQTLVGMSRQISSTAGELTTSIAEIVKTTHEMTDNVKVQQSEMSATLQTAGSLGGISLQTVEQAGKAEQFSGAVSETAASAIGQSDVASRNIGLIRERYQALSEQVKKFQELSSSINRMVESINAISSQINILSFNALIEATNAGEHGRGFSVVADEIQKLAKTTQSSAGGIGALMTGMQESLAQILAGADEVNRAISGGNVQIQAAAESLRDISSRVIELAAAVRAISEMTGREGKDVEKIVKQVGLASGLARDNAAAADRILSALEEQSAASQQFSAMSQELAAVSSNLEGMVRKFKIS